MNSEPVLSVVMPVFNGSAWLAESLDSIRRQDVAGLELIVVDDGSADGSGELARRLFPGVRLLVQENRGAAAARNRGLAAAQAGIVGFLDHDDVWPDGSLRLRLEALQTSPGALFALGRTRFLGAGAEHEPWISPNLGAGLYRRELFSHAGGLNEECRLIEDVDWFLRIREAGLPYVTLPCVTLHYRRGTGGVTHGGSWRDPELLATLRRSLARRREAADHASELALLSGSRTDPRASGPVNHEHRHDPKN